MIDKVLCFLGWHDWEAFRYDSVERIHKRFNQRYCGNGLEWAYERVCLRCGEIDDEISRIERQCQKVNDDKLTQQSRREERQKRARFLTSGLEEAQNDPKNDQE